MTKAELIQAIDVRLALAAYKGGIGKTTIEAVLTALGEVAHRTLPYTSTALHKQPPNQEPIRASACCSSGWWGNSSRTPVSWSHTPTPLQLLGHSLLPRGGGLAGTGCCVQYAPHHEPLASGQCGTGSLSGRRGISG